MLTWAERIEVVRACRLVDRVVEHPVPLHITPQTLDRYGDTCVCHADDMPPEELAFW